MYDLTTQELLTRQKVRETCAELERDLIAREFGGRSPGIRRTLASTLVPWGLRLDRAAGEQALDFKPAPLASEGRR
ncbi:MAG: hypothetical protein WBD55_04745 [Dehalococcoidia bacterium]